MRVTDLERIGERVRSYVLAYFQELRSQLARYNSVQDAFPDHLKKNYKVLAILGRDGLIVAFYSSEQVSFEFGISTQTTRDIIFALSGVKFRLNFDPEMEFTIDNILSRNLERDERSKTIAAVVGVSPWERLLRTSDVTTKRWSEDHARREASNEIAGFLTARLLELDKNNVGTLIDRLEDTVMAFVRLLDTEPREEELQRFLMAHQVLLAPSAVRVIPKLRLGTEYQTDFVIEIAGGDYVFVEIERPDIQLFNKKGDPSAELTHAIRQAQDWREWVTENISYARKSLPDLSDPVCWVVIGRRRNLRESHRKLLKRQNNDNRNVEVFTYDDLAERAQRYLRNLRTYWKRQDSGSRKL